MYGMGIQHDTEYLLYDNLELNQSDFTMATREHPGNR